MTDHKIAVLITIYEKRTKVLEILKEVSHIKNCQFRTSDWWYCRYDTTLLKLSTLYTLPRYHSSHVHLKHKFSDNYLPRELTFYIEKEVQSFEKQTFDFSSLRNSESFFFCSSKSLEFTFHFQELYEMLDWEEGDWNR